MKKHIFFLLLIAVIPDISFSQIFETVSAPGSANILSFTANDSYLFAAFDGNTRRSADQGENWQALSALVLSTTVSNHGIIMESNDDYVLIASQSGLFKSSDNGAVWTELHPFGTGVSGPYSSYDMFSTVSICGDTVFVVTNEVTYRGTYRSIDQGQTWNKVWAAAMGGITCVGNGVTFAWGQISTDGGLMWSSSALTSGFTKLINNNGTLYAGIVNAPWIVKSTDLGASWVSANTSSSTPLDDRVADVIAINNTLYVTQTWGRKAHKSDVGSDSWETLNTPSGDFEKWGYGDGTLYLYVRASAYSGLLIKTFVGQIIENYPPDFTSTPIATAQVGQQYSYTITATDREGDNISYSLQASPAGMTISGNTVSWTPTSSSLGSNSVTVIALDEHGASSTQIFVLSVQPESSNNPPVFTSSPVTTAQVGQQYTYTVTATDVDGDAIIYTLSSYPVGMTISNNIISWTPTSSAVGANAVTIVATDSPGATATQSFNLVVQGSSSNNPPVFTSTAPTSATVGTQYSYTVLATDADGDNITYSLQTKPTGMDISNNTIIWTPSSVSTGTYQVTILATDARGATATQSFDLVVSPRVSTIYRVRNFAQMISDDSFKIYTIQGKCFSKKALISHPGIYLIRSVHTNTSLKKLKVN